MFIKNIFSVILGVTLEHANQLRIPIILAAQTPISYVSTGWARNFYV
jgi:hypothetical protein